MSNLFVSYARADQQIVQSLVGELRELGHDPFYDQNLTGGQRWWDVLLDRIQGSHGFMPVLSEEYRKSEACHLEADWAHQLGVPFLPIDLGQIGPELFSNFISESNWVRYSLDDRGSIARLARAIGSLPPPELPSPLPERPAVPISYLEATGREIRSSAPLTVERQLVIIATLRGKLRTNEDASARVLLRELRDRTDVTYTNALDIDRLLATPRNSERADSAPSPGSSTARPQTGPYVVPAAQPPQPNPPQSAMPRQNPAQPTPAQRSAPYPGQQYQPQPSANYPPTQPPPWSPQPQQQRRPQDYQQPARTRRPVYPLTWALLGLGALLLILAVFALDWNTLQGPTGRSFTYDYTGLSAKIGDGPGDPGLSIIFFGWLGYLLFVAVVVLSVVTALLPRRIVPLVLATLGVDALTILLAIVSNVLFVNRAEDLFGSEGITASNDVGVWVCALAILVFAAAVLVPRRRANR